MKTNTNYTLKTFLYINTDESLIHIAGSIIGNNKLSLSLTEAVEIIRKFWGAGVRNQVFGWGR